MQINQMLWELLAGGGAYPGAPRPPAPDIPIPHPPLGMGLGGINTNVTNQPKSPPTGMPQAPQGMSFMSPDLAPPPLPPGPGGLSAMPNAQPPMPQPAPPMTVGTPPAAAPTTPSPMPQPGFRQQAAGLFGNGGKTLYQILADTMAGVAGADPTAPALKAFAQGAHGAAGEGKKRTDAKTATDDKAYEREGKDLERQNLRQTMEMDRVKGRDMHLKTLFEIANLASGGDPNKFRQSLQQSAFRGGIPIDEATLDEQTKMAFPQWQGGAKGQGGWTPQSGSAPPKGHREQHNSDPNKWIEWDGTQWIDQDGNPVPTS